jgi:hypothetical protein
LFLISHIENRFFSAVQNSRKKTKIKVSRALDYSSLAEELRDSGMVEKPRYAYGDMYDSWYVQ